MGLTIPKASAADTVGAFVLRGGAGFGRSVGPAGNSLAVNSDAEEPCPSSVNDTKNSLRSLQLLSKLLDN